MKPDKKWLDLYDKSKDKLISPVDFNEYFTEKEICEKKLDVMNIGKVSLTTGKVIVRDPLVYLEKEAEPYFLETPNGEFDTEICVIIGDEEDSDRYAAARVRFSEKEAVKFEEALIGNENLDDLNEGEYFGFNVDAGMACVCDEESKNAFCNFREDWEKEHGEDANIYDDYFADLFKKSYEENPKYQREGGDWINFKIPNTNYHIPMFQSGFGDGAYPVYFGYDKDGNICQIIVQFIDISLAYSEDDEEDEEE